MHTQQQTTDSEGIQFDDPNARTILIQSQEEETEDEALSDVLTSLGDDTTACVRIYRQGPGGFRDNVFVTECLPHEFSLPRLQEEYGGGDFRIHVKKNGRLVKNSLVRVAPPNRAQQPRERDNGLAQVQAQIGALVAVVEKLATQQPVQAPQQSRMEWLRELEVMRSIFSGGQAPRQQEPLDMLMKMIEVQKMLGGLTGGAAGEEPGTMTVLLKAMETFGPALQQAAARKQETAPYQNNPIAPALPGTSAYGVQAPMQLDEAAFMKKGMPEPMVSSVPPGPKSDNEREEEMLRMYIHMLIREAQQNIDPEAYALLITQKMERDQIKELLGPEDWFQKLAQFEPKVNPYGEWFSDLREMVFDILTDQDSEDTTGENPSSPDRHAPAETTIANLKGNT